VPQHPALDDVEYSKPGKSLGLLSVFQYRYLLSLLIKKGIRTRYYGSALGWIWSYIRPLAQFFMYYVVIGILLGANRGIPLFPVYLFSGIIIVNLFSETFKNTTESITGNSSLIQKVYFPRELFSVAAAVGALVHFLPQAVVLMIISLIVGLQVSWVTFFAFLAAIVLVIIFALGLGMFFGAINVIYRDSRNIVDLILMFATWTSPVLYTFEMVKNRAPEWVYTMYMLNLVTSAVELSHLAFWEPLAAGAARPENLPQLALAGLLIALSTLLIGQVIFKKLEGGFAQNV